MNEEQPRKFTVVLEQEADGGYVVHVPALPGCVSQGSSRQEAIDNVREAIAAYLDDMVANGEAIPHDAGAEIVDLDDRRYGT